MNPDDRRDDGHHVARRAHRGIHSRPMEIVRGDRQQMGRSGKRRVHDGRSHAQDSLRFELHGLCAAVVHLCQDRSARGPSPADGVARARGTTRAIDDIQDQRGDSQRARRARASLSRGAAIENVLRHASAKRPADVYDLCQRSQVDALHVFEVFGESDSGRIWIFGNADSDCDEGEEGVIGKW